MKINEFATDITEYDNSATNHKVYAKLRELGYMKLGSGQDATVWAKDEHSVIKILMPTNGSISAADKSFLSFYSFCKAHATNPFLPKFIDVGGENHAVFTLNRVSYRQIAMERLRPIKHNSFEEAMVWLLSDLCDSNRSWAEVVDTLSDPESWENPSTPIMSKMPQLVLSKLKNTQVNAEYQLLFTTMQVLFKAGRFEGQGWDLHTENVMQRKDGTLVIVDPYYTI